MTSMSLLLSWELRQLIRSKLLWLTLAIVAAVFIWGALSGAALHRSQAEARAGAQAREQAWLDDIRARTAKYERPSATPLPYWQDPTHVAGFSQYFLLKHSFKPHLPLSALAVGTSDLLPDRQQIKLATLSGTDDHYDFQNPRGLALGRFDLAFAVVQLLPIAIILLAVLACTYERDRGILRFIAAQSVSSRRWQAARLGALAIVLVPSVAALLVLALGVAGAPVSQSLPELGAALALLVAYVLFWLAVCAIVLSAWPRASSALAALGAIWLVLVMAVPLLANAGASVQPPLLSAARTVDVKRQVSDEVQQRRDEIVEAAFRASPDLAGLTDRIPQIDYSTRLTFLVPELESRLEFLQEAKAYTRERSAQHARWVGFIAPNVGLESALTTLAGTDLARHWAFEEQSRAYQLRLRAFFFPLMHRQIVEPTPYRAYGHFSFTDFDSVPGFEMQDRGAGERVRAAILPSAWLLFLTLALSAISFARLRNWPEVL
jgi:ABC-2 type transport system permease protein